MPTALPELIQFERSHYNDKARWALDYKAVAHTRTCLLPGLHLATVSKLTGGRTTPILRIDGEIVDGAANIIDVLESRYPSPPLYPSDPAERERALEIQEMFDDEVGGAVRSALFAVFLDAPGYFSTVFSTHCSLPMRLLYRAAYPVARKAIIAEMNLLDADHIRSCVQRTEEAFDFVAEHAGPRGYLVGDSFTVADLTAAALLAPAVELTHPQMKLPEPKPAPVVAWQERWADHPGSAWVKARYEKDRPASAAQ